MDAFDLNWMPQPVRRAFDEGVRLYAEAVRDGTVMHMQDGAAAMANAAQLHVRLQALGAGREAADPSI